MTKHPKGSSSLAKSINYFYPKYQHGKPYNYFKFEKDDKVYNPEWIRLMWYIHLNQLGLIEKSLKSTRIVEFK